MPAPIPFYFDFVSPFAYLGWSRSRALAARHDRVLEPIPILFAGLLNHYGQLGPAEVEPKRRFVFRQALRRAHRWGLPFGPPPSHPFNPLLSLRIASLDDATLGARRDDVIDALFDAAWGRPTDPIGVATPEQVERALAPLALDVNAVIAAATTDANKQRVKDATADAIARGVFGVPTLMVGDEPFWGSDVLDDVEDALAGRDPIDEHAFARWAALQASATRR